MRIKVICEKCGSTFAVASRSAGQTARCPKCFWSVAVPLSAGKAEPHNASTRSFHFQAIDALSGEQRQGTVDAVDEMAAHAAIRSMGYLVMTVSAKKPRSVGVVPTARCHQNTSGRFFKISKLAEGGFGETFRAWDSQEGVPVVLKQPLAQHLKRPDLLQRFDREINRLVTLIHPHIVPFVDNGHDEQGLPFFAMRFLPAGSLADRKKPVTPAFLHSWLPDIADALDYIHSKGVLHRDVKPANIFFDTRNEAYLGDFGIAKLMGDGNTELAPLNDVGLPTAHDHPAEDSLTRTGGVIGTYAYMAPESFLNRPELTERSDQYSLAVTVFEMLSGLPPVVGTSEQIKQFHAKQLTPRLSLRIKGLPESLYEALGRALSTNPADRYATCREFVACLLTHVPEPARRSRHYQFLCPSCKRLVKVPKDFGGKSCRCPDCRDRLSVSKSFDALWRYEETPHAAVETRQKTKHVSELRQHNTPRGEEPISQRAHMPWGCLTVAAGSLFVMLIAIGCLPTGFFEGRFGGVGSLSLVVTLFAVGCAGLVFITASLFAILGYFAPTTVGRTPDSSSRHRTQ